MFEYPQRKGNLGHDEVIMFHGSLGAALHYGNTISSIRTIGWIMMYRSQRRTPDHKLPDCLTERQATGLSY